MSEWCVHQREVAGQIVYEVIRIQGKGNHESDYLRLGNAVLFDSKEEALELADKLNIKEKNNGYKNKGNLHHRGEVQRGVI